MMTMASSQLLASTEHVFANCHRERFTVPIWRSKFSVNLMLPKEERK